ncbi:MAG: arsenate reductase ArsC [Erysipelotrichaceae bacterium]
MPLKVAFVCVHNACRSQIAEALGNMLGHDYFEAYSAGSQVQEHINEDAVFLMKQMYDIDMEKQHSKLFSELPDCDIVISMGCNVVCPTLPCTKRIDWNIEDPTGQSEEIFRKTIYQIEKNIKELIETIKKSDNH